MSKTEFLFLSEKELLELGVLNAKECVSVCEDVFGIIHDGDYLMGGLNHNEHGLSIVFPKESKFPNMPIAGPERRFIAMPAYLGGDYNLCGEKWYGSNVKNPKERGLPRSVLMITLNDPETCEPKCYMSGNLISSMRTGCIPGVYLKYYGNPNSKILGVVGVGPVQKATLLAVHSVMPNVEKVICNAAHIESAERFSKWVTEETGMEAVAVETMEEALINSDIVSIAASPKKPIYIKDEWIKEGANVLLTSPIEADDAFWLNNNICFDNNQMHIAYYEEALQIGSVVKANNGWGKMYQLIENQNLPALSESVSLGDVVRGMAEGRKEEKSKEIFVTSGQVLFDLAWGNYLYKKALNKDLGIKLNLWDDPYWK